MSGFSRLRRSMSVYDYLQLRLTSNRNIKDCGYITFCWLWTGAKTDRGYGSISSMGKTYRVHRLAAQFWLANYTDTLKVLHKCDIPLCFNPEHLFQGTQKENVHDSINKGTHYYWGRK